MERTDKPYDVIVIGVGVVGIDTEYANLPSGKLFPGARDCSAEQFRSGLRPAALSNLPAAGRTGFPNLWLNVRRRTLRWTHGRACRKPHHKMIAQGDGPAAA